MKASGPATTTRAVRSECKALCRRPTLLTAGSKTSPKGAPREGRCTTWPSVKTSASRAYRSAASSLAASRSAGCSPFAARYARTLRGALRDLVFVLSLTSRFYRLAWISSNEIHLWDNPLSRDNHPGGPVDVYSRRAERTRYRNPARSHRVDDTGSGGR